MNPRSWLQKAVLIFLSVLLSVFIAEAVLRCIYPAQVKYFVWQPNLTQIFHADTGILKGVKPRSRFSINAEGVRTERANVGLFYNENGITASNKKYILCLGGSTTECLYLDDSATWPAQLIRCARYANDSSLAFVGNIGKSGCSTRENYIHLKYCVSQYKKITNVILMVGLNDLIKRLAKDSVFDSGFHFNAAIEDSLVQAILLKQGRGIGNSWWRKTALFYLFQNAYHKINPAYANSLVEDDSGQAYKGWRKNRQHAAVILDSLPDLKIALDEYSRNLNLIIDEAEKQHLGIVFVNQAAWWKDSMSNNELSKLWMGGIGKYQMEEGHKYYAASALRRGLELYNNTLMNVCASRKVKCINIDSQLPRAETVFYDDCHFTDYGAALTAKLIYGAIR